MIAAENKQHSSKGNFILSGEGIPRPSPNEDLFDIVFTPIFEKYDIWVYPQELKAIHRLPNNKIFFSLLTRLPGYSFDKLIHAMNGNPKAHIKVYISIQRAALHSQKAEVSQGYPKVPSRWERPHKYFTQAKHQVLQIHWVGSDWISRLPNPSSTCCRN